MRKKLRILIIVTVTKKIRCFEVSYGIKWTILMWSLPMWVRSSALVQGIESLIKNKETHFYNFIYHFECNSSENIVIIFTYIII